MNLRNTKLLIGVFVLLIYLSIGVFGLFEFSHIDNMSKNPMTNCPYSENGFSVCDNSLSHINNWRQFSNVIFPLLFIFSFLILGIFLYFIGKQNFLNQKQYFYKWKYYLAKKVYTYLNKITKWLSLLENSPSFAI